MVTAPQTSNERHRWRIGTIVSVTPGAKRFHTMLRVDLRPDQHNFKLTELELCPAPTPKELATSDAAGIAALRPGTNVEVLAGKHPVEPRTVRLSTQKLLSADSAVKAAPGP